MKFSHFITCVDSHTAGEPTRIVTSGIPKLRGKTVAEKRDYFKENLDYLRTFLMHEPRGHNDMFGAVVVEPSDEKADLGIIFIDCGGYLDGCGHGTIGVATVAVETGLIEAREPETKITIETPSGLVETICEIKDGHVEEVKLRNVPSFLYDTKEVDVPGFGKVEIDIAFGGNFFAIVDVKQVKLKINPKNSLKLIDAGLKIRDAINKQVEVIHPMKKYINKVNLVEFYDDPDIPEAHCKNVVVFGNGQIDRSPCGTGTSAKIATLYAKGKLKLGEEFIHESILKTVFRGKALKETKIGKFKGIIPEIKGKAYITGFNQLVMDPKDPLKHGFQLK